MLQYSLYTTSHLNEFLCIVIEYKMIKIAINTLIVKGNDIFVSMRALPWRKCVTIQIKRNSIFHTEYVENIAFHFSLSIPFSHDVFTVWRNKMTYAVGSADCQKVRNSHVVGSSLVSCSANYKWKKNEWNEQLKKETQTVD